MALVALVATSHQCHVSVYACVNGSLSVLPKTNRSIFSLLNFNGNPQCGHSGNGMISITFGVSAVLTFLASVVVALFDFFAGGGTGGGRSRSCGGPAIEAASRHAWP